jgi:dTDP-4-dehydrorhamnose reductase
LLNVESSLVESVDETYFAAPAQRPFNTSLDHRLWGEHGIEFPDWKIELNDFLRSWHSH